MLDLETPFIRCIFLAMALMTLTACGEVITPQPTVVTPSTIASAPTSALAASTPTFHPTATAPLLPLAATATPTITPTPVTHVIQEGETLLSIAYEYGVSLQALQAANDIENPLLLQIGQELVIPIGEETTETTLGLLLPTPTPLPFSAQAVAFYETPVGGLECLGEITNTTALTLTNVLVRVTLHDDTGAALMAGDALAAVDLIPPGSRSPFRILFTAPPTTWASPQVTIIRGEAAGALAAAYVPITVTEVESQPSGSQFQVSGIVRNDSAEQAAGHVSVIVTTYDAQGLVTGFRQGTVETEGPLAPGATAPFTLLFTYHGDVPTDFNVVALSRILTE
ncbi:MAG: LysM peptidoglycan-binding domain-containing protein [Anaerolineae bacterium]|nr:LysM peptidoglycan-binding domain-containing protein [Anaerolineae bacterium]